MALLELQQGYIDAYKAETERINALGVYAVNISNAYKNTEDALMTAAKRAAFEEALNQVKNLTLQLNERARDIESERAGVERNAARTAAFENGFGYSSQNPKLCWDAFFGLLHRCSPESQSKINSLPISDEQRTSENFVNPNHHTAVAAPNEANVFSKLAAWMLSGLFYPKQLQPLHLAFTEQILPAVEQGVTDRLAVLDKQSAEIYKSEIDLVNERLIAAGVAVPQQAAPKSGG